MVNEICWVEYIGGNQTIVVFNKRKPTHFYREILNSIVLAVTTMYRMKSRNIYIYYTQLTMCNSFRRIDSPK